MSQKYIGGIITKNPTAPTTSAASGMWTLDQAANYVKQGIWPSPPLVIGQAYAGGFYAGQIGVSGVATHNLVVGPVASAQNASKQWKTANTSTTGTSSVIDGPTNSANMNNASHPAAEFCEGLTIGGFSDWYMPAKNELEVCYYNLKSGTTNNVTTTGDNTNAVPSRGSNYTTGNPAQTSATIFQTGNAEAFNTVYYWASTEGTSSTAWAQYFSNGDRASGYAKTTSYRVRAIRRVAV